MKIPGLFLSFAALVLAGGVYVVFQHEWASSGLTVAVDRRSDMGLHPAHSANAPVIAAGDNMAVTAPANAPATQTEVAALRTELTQLRAALADLRRQLHGVSAAATVAADGDSGKPPMNANAQAQEERQRLQEMDALESQFRQEPADTVWSSRTSSQVDEALAGIAVTPAGVRDLECRARTCRVEIAGNAVAAQDDDDPASLDKGLPLLAQQLAGSLPSLTAFQVDDGHGGMNTVLYFSRDADEPPPSAR